MRITILSTALIALVSTSALAGEGYNQGNHNSATSHSYAKSRSQAKSAAASGSQSDNSVSYNNRNPVSTAFAAPLVASDDSCQGSLSGGTQFTPFGISLGGTHSVDDCFRLKYGRELDRRGDSDVATALYCQNPMVRQAMEDVGRRCPGNADDSSSRADVNSRAYPTGTKAINR